MAWQPTRRPVLGSARVPGTRAGAASAVAAEAEGSAAPLALNAPLAQELLRLLWEAPMPALLEDPRGRLLAVNAAFAAFVGAAESQLLGRELRTLWPDGPPDARPPAPGAALPPPVRFVAADGRERWVRGSRRPLRGDAGQPLALWLLQDCSGERLALQALEPWFELSPLGIAVFDDAGALLRRNAALDALLGALPASLAEAPAPLQALFGWPAEPGQAPLRETESALVTADGRRLQLRARLRLLDAAPGEPGGRRWLALVEDRTPEAERDLARLEMGALMDTAGVGVATFEESAGWLQRSAAPRGGGAGAGGHSMPAALQAIGRDIVEPGSMAEYERLQHALKHGERAEVRYAVRHPDVGQRWLLTRVEPGRLASGKRTTSVVTLDVTEQEQALARNAQLLRELSTTLDGSPAGIAYLRGDALVRCNERFERMLGVPGGAAVSGARLHELLAAQPHAREALADAMAALRSRPVVETELQLLRSAGHGDSGFGGLGGLADDEPGSDGTAWCSLSVRRADGAGPQLEAVAVLTDISRIKQQQQALEELARERELMFNLSEVGIAYLRGGRIVRANPALAALAGYAPAELVGLAHAELFEDAAAHQRFVDHEAPLLAHLGRVDGERPLRRRDGSLRWVHASLRLVDEADPLAGVICSFVDIDERRRAREELALQAERTRAILDSVLVGIVTVGPAGIEWMNRSARRMFGGELADFVGEPIATVATAEADHPLRRDDWLATLADGQAESFECQLQGRDGRTFWVVGNAVATGRGSAHPQLTFALLDIERRRQAEISIAQARASLQRIIETAPLAIALLDARSYEVLQLNQMAAQFAGRSIETSVGKLPHELLPAERADALVRDLQAALQNQELTQRELRVDGPDGEPRVWDARIVPLAGTPEQLLFVASDVTEQRAAAQARFDAAIAQRELLVKEVHHRIKNNLQGVAGLMQQIAQRRPEVAPVIGEAVGQVQAIAHVYGLQVGAGGPLALHGLLLAITASVQRISGREIAVTTEGADPGGWVLPENESIPIALTVNELLTNAAKHSPAGSVVQCRLEVPAADDGALRIVIANTGRLPAGFTLGRVRGGVSGLGLVRALLPRRHAALAIVQQGEEVCASIELRPPVVIKSPP